jgi:HD-GYP domain-containing protein (c-di-GMP phosphodiesterase class II)
MSKIKNFTGRKSQAAMLAKALNLMNPHLENHHEQTSYMAYQLSKALGLDDEAVMANVEIALLHDIGSVTTGNKPISKIDTGTGLLEQFSIMAMVPEFHDATQIIQGVHKGAGQAVKLGIKNPDQKAIVQMSDYISTIFSSEEETSVLNRVPKISKIIHGMKFSHKLFEAFDQLTKKESVWLDMENVTVINNVYNNWNESLSLDDAQKMTFLLSTLVDYRSPFTRMPLAGVAATAKTLASLYGMSEDECIMMDIAGNLHDIGKILVPRKILEKNGKLTDEEFNKIKEHPYYTRMVIGDAKGYDQIINWAADHHEKLNGTGYPFHKSGDELVIHQRIMAVADIFSAITEDRPYCPGMNKEQALAVLHDNVASGGIDGEIVDLLEKHYELVVS